MLRSTSSSSCASELSCWLIEALRSSYY
jgi:hypothetical protein